MPISPCAGIPVQPLSRAMGVNARIRQLIDRDDIDEHERTYQYGLLLEEWALATRPAPAPLRAA
ncbi:hypothetical protein [Streptomyces bacillaris]|uniref:hypothetical protein n=1 Tax=Streptomyces bacillaris TaxID=68179 RepID=UPI00382BB492